MRGPKRKAGKRTASGRLSKANGEVIERLRDVHDREERETLSVGLEARARVFGLDSSVVRDQMAGSVVGRLCLTKEISRAQYDAAQSWLGDVRAYRQAINAPRVPGAVDLNAIRGDSTEAESEAWVRRITRRMEAARAAANEAIRREQEIHGNRANLWAALDLIVGQDQMHAHLLGDLKLALNALAHHYGHGG